jgi:hypothetical protein
VSDFSCTVGQLFVHPIKSCAGIAVDAVPVGETGLDLDREWMVVDEQGTMLTQRQLPRMALIRPELRSSDLLLRAPGMLALHLSLEAVEAPARVRVWDDVVKAWDMGALAAQWFSDFLGRPGLRLARFDPDERRLASRKWTGEIDAPVAFADGFPILVTSTASLAELNRRLQAAGQATVGSERFRPNVVLDGLADANGEDYVDTVRIEAPEGAIVLKLVKPCVRCTIPDVDPASGAQGHAVGDTLVSYRADARMGGGLTFGMNAVVVEGTGRTLRVGAQAQATIAF